MRIAQVAPLEESVPPQRYGGTERVVANLTENLIDLGHDVTLFASAGSRTRAPLVSGAPEALGVAGASDTVSPLAVLFESILERAGDFDVVHFHTEYLHLPVARRLGVPYLTTVHNRPDAPELKEIFETFPEAPFVAISDAQRALAPAGNWFARVYHGLDPDAHDYEPHPDAYLAFVSRISPEKGVERAIRVARRADMPLVLAGRVNPQDTEYFERRIEPLLDDSLVSFRGEVDESEKVSIIQGARALLFPIDWPEPFGLIMIEAFACGTPVVAWRHGAVPEVVEDGLTGFVVEDEDEAVAALRHIDDLDRADCRRAAQTRFHARRMAEDYVDVYRDLLETQSASRKALAPPHRLDARFSGSARRGA